MVQDEGHSRGAVRHVEVGEEGAGQRLDNFLVRLLGDVPRSHVYRLVRRGEVRVNGRRAKPEQRLEGRDSVRIPPLRIEPAAALAPGRTPLHAQPPGESSSSADAGRPGLPPQGGYLPAPARPGRPSRPSPQLLARVAAAITYEDDRLLVVDKPAGLAVHGGSGLSFGLIEVLRALRPQEELELVHRLDRDTSGCLLVARRRSSLRTLHALLREGQIEKGYLALVKGHWNLGRHRIEAPLRTDLRVGGERTVKVHPSGKAAVSEFRPVQFFGSSASGTQRATLVEVALYTGRTHQIRVHAAHAGHPVAGDEKYGDEAFNRELRARGLARMFLHAHRVSFAWPGAGEFSASAPLPPELRTVIERLETERPPKAPRGRAAGARKRPR